jgi:hypothetical protein
MSLTTSPRLPLSELRPVRIRELRETALCYSYDKRATHLFVVRLGDFTTAVCLNGEYAFRAFDVDVVNNWKGLVIPEARIEVELGSAFDYEVNSAPLGALLVGYQGARIRVEMKSRRGFDENIDLPLGLNLADVSGSLDVGFRKWSFVIGRGDEGQCVLSFDLTGEGTAD